MEEIEKKKHLCGVSSEDAIIIIIFRRMQESSYVCVGVN